MVILDLDSVSSDGDDSVVLSKLLYRFKKGDRSGQSSTLAPTIQSTCSPTHEVSSPRDVPHP